MAKSKFGSPVSMAAFAALASAVVAVVSCSGGGDSSSQSSGGSSGTGGGSGGVAGKTGGSSGTAGSGTSIGEAGLGGVASGGTGNVAGTSSTGGSAASGGSSAGSGGSNSGGSSAGIAGANGGEAGAATAPPPDCDDHNAKTVDFYKPAYGCGHLLDSNPDDGESWINYDAGFSVDPKTSTAWYYENGSTLVTQDQARALCASLTIGNIVLRLPTIDDARALAYNCPATVAGGTCPIHDPVCLSKACGYGTVNDCESCLGGGDYYVNPDAGPFREIIFHTSSICSDATPPDTEWEYGIFNGNFLLASPSDTDSLVCVSANLPDALP